MSYVKKIVSYVYRIMFNLIATVTRPIPKTVLFESFSGKLPGDSPYPVYQALQQAHPDWRLVFGVKARYYDEAVQAFPDVVFMKRFSARWLFYAPRAQYWIFNARFPEWLKKNTGTTYIQIWHGTPLKKLGLDIDHVSMPGYTTAQYHERFVKDSHRWDYLVAQNSYSEQIFSRAFDFHGQYLEIGYPRNDRLVKHRDDAAYQRKLREQLVGRVSGKVIMYAPTWRDDNFVRPGVYRLNLPFDLAKVSALLGPDNHLIIRPHYLVADAIDVSAYPNISVEASADIADLYLISDALVTDYSSVMFDYAIMGRPMLFFPYDEAHYEDDTRGFYFDYEQVPGPIIHSATDFYDQLSKLISNEDQNLAEVTAFQQQYCPWDNGRASNAIATLVDEKHQ